MSEAATWRMFNLPRRHGPALHAGVRGVGTQYTPEVGGRGTALPQITLGDARCRTRIASVVPAADASHRRRKLRRFWAALISRPRNNVPRAVLISGTTAMGSFVPSQQPRAVTSRANLGASADCASSTETGPIPIGGRLIRDAVEGVRSGAAGVCASSVPDCRHSGQDTRLQGAPPFARSSR